MYINLKRGENELLNGKIKHIGLTSMKFLLLESNVFCITTLKYIFLYNST